jgi:prophage regulatory protein
MTIRILRRKSVEERTGLSRSGIYKKMGENNFPKPINLGGRNVGWIEEDIENWINQCIKNSNQPFIKGGRHE